MVEFETLETKDINFGNNKFLEVARKKAKTPEGETKFISISKGFILPTGSKRFKNALGFEANRDIIDGLIDALQKIKENIETKAPSASDTTSQTTEEAPSETANEKVESTE